MRYQTTNPTYPSLVPPRVAPGILPVRYASFWRRGVALAIDTLVIGVLVNLVAPVVGTIAVPLVHAVYEAILLAVWDGQTIGNKITGIRIVAAGGQHVGIARSVVRAAIQVLSGAVLMLGYLWMLWDRDRQTWHDKVAGTYVIRA